MKAGMIGTRNLARTGAGRRKTESPKLLRIISSSDTSAERQVYQKLRNALMTGQISPGSRLTTRSLSEELGVSPTPIREALKRLEGDGVLVSRRKSAFFVNDPDITEFNEILEIRLELEGLAIRQAAAKATRAKLAAAIAANQAYMRVLSRHPANATETLSANFRFHFELYKLSESATLVDIIKSLWLRIGPCLRHYSPSQASRSIGKYHQHMLDSVARGNADEAEAALRQDLTTAARAIVAAIETAWQTR